MSIDLKPSEVKRLVMEQQERAAFLHATEERAQARLVPYTEWTPDDRFRAFERMRFYPHGLFIPDNQEVRDRIKLALKRAGDLTDVDQRLRIYRKIQAYTAEISSELKGRWSGQMALARSTARFRVVAWSRRGGKTTYCAAEGLGHALERPRSTIWLAAPDMGLVERSFSVVVQMIRDLDITPLTFRNSEQAKLIVLPNGSKIEGVSLHDYKSVAGDKVDLAVVDEAAQLERDQITRAILPPLVDRNGQALFISSWEGAEGFFYELHQQVKGGTDSAWETFTDASYDINFYMFPQGRKSKALLDVEAVTPVQDFLEQYSGIAASARNLVFPEFRERVHVGSFPYNPDKEVTLAIDPCGGGADAYAILAIQDYDTHLFVVDEVYETHATAESLFPRLKEKPWFNQITAAVVDSAMPAEIQRWIRFGLNAFPVFEKPKIDERLPFHRNALRDPTRFKTFYDQLAARVRDDMGLEPDAELTANQEYMVLQEVEQKLSDDQISQEHIQALRDCARVFINKTCAGFINEHRKYRFIKRRMTGPSNFRREPLDAFNHSMDAFGYFLWQFKRHDRRYVVGDYSYVTIAESDNEMVSDAPPVPAAPEVRHGFLQQMRRMYDPTTPRDQSYLTYA
jgi:hypothetical protein